MYALGLLFQLVLGWSFSQSVLLSAAIVLAYTSLGGLTSAIYNEVLQFFLIVLGFAPLAILSLMKAGGWDAMASRLPAVMTHSWQYMGARQPEPHGRRDLRHDGRIGICALVRILVHGLPGGAARDGRREHVGRAAHAGAGGVPQDDHAVHRDRAGHRGAGALQDGGGLRPSDEVGLARLRPGAHHADGEVLSRRHAGRGNHGADGVVHVGHGGQRHRVQHRFHLRHLSELHPPQRARRPLPDGGPADHDFRHAAFHRHGVPGPRATTTSWICCSSCSAS